MVSYQSRKTWGRNMNPTRLNKLLQDAKFYQRPKGQIIYTFDDQNTFYLIKSGYIKRYLIANDGALGVQSIYGPGYFFPLTPVFSTLFDQNINRGAETYYYQTMTPVQIYCIENSVLAEKVKEYPLLYKDLLFESGRRLQSNIQQLENVSFRHADRRLAHQLVYFARQFGEKTDSGTKISLPLTQQDLADILSLTRETVSREMSKLKNKQLIIPGQYIIVPDIDKLQSFYH